MTNETLAKMLAGLSEDERTATLTELGVTDPAQQAGFLSAAAAVHNTAVTQPTFSAPQAVTPVVAQPAAVPVVAAAATGQPGQDVLALQQQLALERTGRVAAECESFMAANATRITPAEHVGIRGMYATLGAMSDPTALNQYKASLQARPVNPLMAEQVASGAAVVLGSQGADTRTEAQKEADAISALLGSTDAGKEALSAALAGKGDLAGAFTQFAVTAPVGLGK